MKPQQPPKTPSPSTFEYTAGSKRQRTYGDNNNDDIGWTEFSKKEKPVKPIQAPSLESFERFSNKNSKQSETLS